MVKDDLLPKKISFSPTLLKLAEYKAKKLGISFHEYIRHLVSNDVQDIFSKFEILSVDELKTLEEFLDPDKNPKFAVSKNKNSLATLLDAWKKERENTVAFQNNAAYKEHLKNKSNKKLLQGLL